MGSEMCIRDSPIPSPPINTHLPHGLRLSKFLFCCATKHVAVSPPVTVPRLPHSPAAEMAHENVRVLTSTLLRHVHVSPHSPVSLRTCTHTHVTTPNVRRPNSDALM